MARYCLSGAVDEMKAPLMMVVVHIALAGVNILSKLAASDGMNLMLAVTYSLTIATGVMGPLAFFLERPKITWTVLVQAFFCGLFGASMFQNLYLASLSLTSATYVSAMSNPVPAVTFVLAISFGLEKARLKTAAGKAKVLGTLTGIGGAMLLTFYKGVEVDLWSTHVNLLHHAATTLQGQGALSNRILGSLLAVASCFCCALWFIVQMSEGFPYHYTSTALMCFMGSIQAVLYALCRERDWSQWKLGWNIRLLTVSYSGIIASGLCNVLVAWCVRMRGPLFVSAFNPLMLVTVALAGSFVLDEKLHLGSILGSGLIILGLYAVLWGKRKEMEWVDHSVPPRGLGPGESLPGDSDSKRMNPPPYRGNIIAFDH